VTNDNAIETHVSLLKVPEVSWHAQLHWGGLTLQEGQLYTLEFSARSELPRRLPVSTRLDKADWHNCGLAEEADLGPQWKTYSYPFRATQVEPGQCASTWCWVADPQAIFQSGMSRCAAGARSD